MHTTHALLMCACINAMMCLSELSARLRVRVRNLVHCCDKECHARVCPCVSVCTCQPALGQGAGRERGDADCHVRVSMYLSVQLCAHVWNLGYGSEAGGGAGKVWIRSASSATGLAWEGEREGLGHDARVVT